MKKVTAPVLWFVVILLLGSVFPSVKIIRKAQAQEDDPKIILVKLKDAPKTSAILSLSESISDSEFVGGLPSTNLVVYKVNGDENTALSQARENSNVEAAFKDVKISALKVTNDDQYDKQWALYKMKVGTNPRATPPIDSAWDKIANINIKTAAIKVAVLDSGIDFSLPELSGKQSNEPSLEANQVNCTFTESGGTPETDCKHSGNINDDFGHGTHVAGIIGAEPNNSNGIAGAGWGVKLMSVKVLDSSGGGNFLNVLLGIAYAMDHGAKIINLSLGAIEDNFKITSPTPPQTENDYINLINDFTRDAYNKGVVLVAAAGNCGDAVQHVTGEIDSCDKLDDNGNFISHLTNPKMYPAAANHVLAVAAMGKENELAPYSEYGNWIDVAAPGGYGTAADPTELILSTMKELYCIAPHGIKPTGTTNLCYMQGTSMSAPQVAGVLALIFAKNPHLTADMAVRYITDFANNDLPTGNTNATIYGGVDALRSLTAVNANATPTGFSSPSPTGPTRTPTPTRAPTLTLAPSLYPTTGAAVLPRPSPNPAGQFCPEDLEDNNCSSKSSGDANCDQAVNAVDYSIWKTQYDKLVSINDYDIDNNANFSCVEGNTTTYYVDLVDFEIWRRGTSGFVNLTLTPVPSNTPAQPSDTPAQPSNTPRPPTNTPHPPTNTPRPPTDTPVPEPTWVYRGDCYRAKSANDACGQVYEVITVTPEADCGHTGNNTGECAPSWQNAGYQQGGYYQCYRACVSN